MALVHCDGPVWRYLLKRNRRAGKPTSQTRPLKIGGFRTEPNLAEPQRITFKQFALDKSVKVSVLNPPYTYALLPK
jgi:hypothetical protein